MKQFIQQNKKALSGIGAAILIGLVTLSFQDSPLVQLRPEMQQTYDDTLPQKKKEGMTMKEFDQAMEELDRNVHKIGEELKEIDFALIRKNVENALKEVDMDKIMKEARQALKSVDLEKIMNEVRSSLKEIDTEKINAEVNEAMKEAKKELDKARIELDKVDKQSVKKAMEEARRELDKAKEEIKKIDMDKIRSEVDKGIGEAKAELTRIKPLFNEIEKDGLISSKEGFKIEYKDKQLYINGKKQPSSVTEKYRHYFSKEHFEITIDKD